MWFLTCNYNSLYIIRMWQEKVRWTLWGNLLCIHPGSINLKTLKETLKNFCFFLQRFIFDYDLAGAVSKNVGGARQCFGYSIKTPIKKFPI